MRCVQRVWARPNEHPEQAMVVADPALTKAAIEARHYHDTKCEVDGYTFSGWGLQSVYARTPDGQVMQVAFVSPPPDMHGTKCGGEYTLPDAVACAMARHSCIADHGASWSCVHCVCVCQIAAE
jgi:hypothetical protein